jgi:cysteinyl-tRNA synthetase
LSFYNSRSKSIELLNNDKNKPITIYTCGPTVYNKVHIGNLKTFLWSDFIVCYLQALGYKTKHIMNITDIDDKIINSLETKNTESLLLFTQHYTDLFLKDIEKIGIKNYTKQNIHKVTDNITPIVNLITNLLNKNYAYQLDDGSVYFDTSKIDNYPFPDYQKETFEKDNDYERTRKIIKSKNVKSKNDFILWKPVNDNDIFWITELGKGKPSWNAECSGLALEILETIDIKIGGIDLKMPHHTCEILQAEAFDNTQLYGKYFIHCGFLNFSGDKMSKSLGNILRLEDVKFNYYLLRLYFFTKSYRNTFEFNEEEINTLKTNFINFHMLYNKLSLGFIKSNIKQNYPIEKTYIYEDLLKIIANDFNTKDALYLFFNYVDKLLKVYMNKETSENVLNELNKVNNLFNLLDVKILQISNETIEFINKREELRKNKQFNLTDKMRLELQKNYYFEDEQTGYLIINKI